VGKLGDQIHGSVPSSDGEIHTFADLVINGGAVQAQVGGTGGRMLPAGGAAR
jgi:hypothetical protein